MFGPFARGNKLAMHTDPPLAVSELVGLPVRVGVVEVGRVTDVLANADLSYVFGLEVRTRAAYGHFVPWVAAVVDGRGVTLTSVFAFLGAAKLTLYVDNGVRLAELFGHLRVGRTGRIEEDQAARAGSGTAVSSSTRAFQLAAKRSLP